MALSYCHNVRIERCRNLAKLDFNHKYLVTGTPVIIEGAANDLPAKDWTLDSLCQRVGQNKVFVRTNTNVKDYRLGTQYKIRETTFQKYIDDLLAQNSRGRSSYLAVQNIKKAFPQLQVAPATFFPLYQLPYEGKFTSLEHGSSFNYTRDDVPLPEYVGKLHAGPFMWIAYKGHYEYCHQDPDDGLLLILSGQKVVRLFAQDMEHLYPNPTGSKGRTTQSQIDCLSPDLDQYPDFAHATCMYETLNAGDMLYIPAFCWHQITTTENTISLNMFWGDAGTNNYISKLLRPQFWPCFSHWLLNVIEQNRQYESFPRILARLPEALYNFMVTQWHDEATPEQLAVLVEHIKEYLDIDQLPDSTIYKSGKFPPKLQIRGLLWRAK